MISMAIILMAMGAIFMAFSVALRLFVDESTRTDVFIEADRGMSEMAKELMGAKQVLVSTSREVSFWLADLNDNGTREAEETVTYAWSGSPESNLNRESAGTARAVAYGVYGFDLTYDDPADPTLISITLNVGQRGIQTTLESSVKLRNVQ